MKKVIIIAAVAIIIIGVLGIFASYQYYKHYQDKLPKTSSLSPAKINPTAVPKPPKNVAVSPTPQAPVGTEEPMNLEFQMTGAVVLPQFKSAFILNTLNSQEEVCQEGAFLHSKEYGRWTVFSIKQDETIIQQYHPDGSVAKEHTLKLIPKSNTPITTTEPTIIYAYRPGEKQSGPFKIEGIDISSPESIDRVISNTPVNDVLGIIRNIPNSVVESVLSVLPQDYLKQKIQESPLGMAVNDETYKDRKPADVVNSLIRVANDYTPKGEKMLSFSTQVNPDNSPISPTAVFGSDAKKIHACFENKGPLAKLDRVIIKWANTYSMKVVYWSAFMINPDATYNYIFVKPEGHWEAGKYLITIYKQPQDAEPVAYGEFEVK